MTDTDTIRQHIAIGVGVGGPKAMIAGHRVRAEDVVVWPETLGMTPATDTIDPSPAPGEAR